MDMVPVFSTINILQKRYIKKVYEKVYEKEFVQQVCKLQNKIY